MKVKKLFGIALLAGSLLLSSCEDLLSNLMGGGNKSKDNESGEKQGYQGKQGQTELSKEEWELAFSLEELALRRNCHLEVTQEETQMKMDIDNGKFKIDVPYYEMSSIYMNFTGMSGKDIKGVQYYPNSDGTYSTHEDQEQLDLVMAEFGVIYLDYDAFTYDKSSKMYKADTYKYEVTYQGKTALSLDCSDCKVTIEDGFPKKLECNIVAGGNGQSDEEPEPMHYEANFSRYNAITVELPQAGENGGNGGNGGNSGKSQLPAIDGQEISFEQLNDKFVERATPNYNNASINVTVTDGATINQTVSLTASKVEGNWVINEAGYESIDMSEFVLTEQMMAELEQEAQDPSIDALKFYNNNKAEGGYIIEMKQTVLNEETGTNSSVEIQMHLNRYFYITAEYVVSDGVYEAIEITWAA